MANNKTLTDNNDQIIYPLTNADQVLVKSEKGSVDDPTKRVFTLTEVVKGVFSSIKNLRDTKVEKGTYTDDHEQIVPFDKTGGQIWDEVQSVERYVDGELEKMTENIATVTTSLADKLDKTGDGSEVYVTTINDADAGNEGEQTPSLIGDNTSLRAISAKINRIIDNMATTVPALTWENDHNTDGTVANRALRDNEGHIIHRTYAKKEDMNKAVSIQGSVENLSALHSLELSLGTYVDGVWQDGDDVGKMYTIKNGGETFTLYYVSGNTIVEGDTIEIKPDDDFVYTGLYDKMKTIETGVIVTDGASNDGNWMLVGGKIDTSLFAKQEIIDDILGNGDGDPTPVARATNANTADKAIADQNGNVIHTTYATKDEVNDIEIDTRNLIPNSANVTTGVHATSNSFSKQVLLPIGAKAGDTFTFNCDSITSNPSSLSEFTLVMFNWGTMTTASAYAEITKENRVAKFTIKEGVEVAEGSLYLLLYAGRGGEAAGNDVTYTNCTLVKGNKPMLLWQAAPEDFQSQLDDKLSLSGGTLTGNLTGTDASFSGTVTADTFNGKCTADGEGNNIIKTYARRDRTDTRNLLTNSEEINIVGTGTFKVDQRKLPFAVNEGDVFTFSCEDFSVGANEPTSHMIALYSPDPSLGVLSNEPYISPDNKTATLTIKEGKSATEVYLNMYVGDYRNPAVATITYKGATLVKGSTAMLMWQPALEDMNAWQGVIGLHYRETDDVNDKTSY